MINWNDFKINHTYPLEVICTDLTCRLKVKLVEYEWSLHREPMLADLQVLETCDETVFPLNSILRLPIETTGFVNFLLFAPCHMSPGRELKRGGFINILN